MLNVFLIIEVGFEHKKALYLIHNSMYRSSKTVKTCKPSIFLLPTDLSKIHVNPTQCSVFDIIKNHIFESQRLLQPITVPKLT